MDTDKLLETIAVISQILNTPSLTTQIDKDPDLGIKVKEFENNFLELMRNKHRAELDVLKSGKLTAEVTDVIKKVVVEMSKSYAE